MAGDQEVNRAVKNGLVWEIPVILTLMTGGVAISNGFHKVNLEGVKRFCGLEA